MIRVIAAIANNGVIGKNDEIPWYLPEDLKNFRRLTDNSIVICGRRTHESIIKRLGRNLPNRDTIVLSRNNYQASGCVVLPSLRLALNLCLNEAWIIGGAAVYAEALPLADELYLTRLEAAFEGDAFFPTVDWGQWLRLSSDRVESKDTVCAFSFEHYARKR